MTRLILKLALAGMRIRLLQAALSVIVVAAATAALTVALGVGRVADRPWERTFEATNGAHVTAMTLSGGPSLAPLARLEGVTGSTGDLPYLLTGFRRDGARFGLNLIGVPAEPPTVERPLLVEGAWPGGGEVVLERSFARFLGIGTGTQLTAGLRVSGVALIPRGEAYPQSQPGLAFALVETLARIEPDRRRWGHLLGLRLADPDASRAFAARAESAVAGAHIATWQDERADAVKFARTSRLILSVFGGLLLLAGGFVLATLIGGRVLAQTRELGLLKAAGLTPGQVARVFLAEQLALGAIGTGLGVAAGTLATPLFVSRSAALLDAPEVPAFDAARVLAVAAVALAAVALCTLVPAWRAALRTTGSILAGPAGSGGGRSRLAALTERLGLPVSAALGARESFRHPARATLTTLSLALTVAAVVATLGMEASLRVDAAPPTAPEAAAGVPAWDPVDDDAGEAARLRPIVYGLDAVLLFVGGVNLLATVLLGVRERVRDLGLLKAAGLTPRQVTTSFVAAQGVLAALAVAIGIPLGLALFRGVIEANGSADEFAYPAWWWLALLAPAGVALVLALATPVARRAAAIRVAEALRYE
jgi:ABC-type lipoprotein release transport system permease subunit